MCVFMLSDQVQLQIPFVKLSMLSLDTSGIHVCFIMYHCGSLLIIFIDFKFSLRIISAGVVIMVALLKVLKLNC